ncbi:MAG TPA: hypothetical protein VH309_05095 [Elusimicrobiota bacterium]|nr:hypothetical protein [Elusimicrobiota bacterium]
MSEPLGPAPSSGLDDATSRALRAVAFAMGGGVALLGAFSLFFYFRSSPAAPSARSVRLVNLLTAVSMAAAFSAIVVSELVWKKMAAGASAADANARTRTAFIARAALREGAALLGTVTFFLACQDGVLRAYPAYWVDLAPAALFWSFLWMHWPSLENLKTELAEFTSK